MFLKDINQVSEEISKWLQVTLTPENLEIYRHLPDFLRERIMWVISHKIELYLSYFGIPKPGGGKTMQFLIEQMDKPMSPEWADTVGKALEQVQRSLGG